MHPYSALPATAFWKNGVEGLSPLAISGMARPAFELTRKHRVGTAGSCFAQHMARHLRRRGFTFIDTEPPPPFLPIELHGRFGFGIYSARYGNIYTTAQLRQTLERAFGKRPIGEAAWMRGDRYFDPFRTAIEPNGFASIDELDADRDAHYRAVRRLTGDIDVFVFTLGLTEAWRSQVDGSVYPIAPGVSGIGEYDAGKYEFVNFNHAEVLRDLSASIALLKRRNPALQIILTVSPVPLAATASGEHVLPATTYSKAVLRAVAGQLAAEREDVSYFPSFEIIASPPYRAMFYEADLRGVTEAGVTHVMDTFVRECCARDDSPVELPGDDAPSIDTVCEEEVLRFYA